MLKKYDNVLKKARDFIELHLLGNFELGAIIFGILFLFISTVGLVTIDHKPATNNDYAPLIVQQETISKDFNKLYSYDNFEIVPLKDSIKVTFENEECELICNFNKDLQFIGYSKSDKAMSLLLVVMASFVVAFLSAIGIVGIIIIMIPEFLMFLLKMIEKICLLLTGGESNNGIKL